MDTLENKIRAMNREVLALKTFHPLKSYFRTFWSEYDIEIQASEHYQTIYYEITYIDGGQPILTDIGATIDESGIGEAWPGMFNLESPNNNKQIVVIWSYAQSEDLTLHMTVQSTRQIMSIRRIADPN